MIVRCYKCGKEFSVREGARSDICPACMSFIDVKKALEKKRGETTLSKQQPERSEELCAADNESENENGSDCRRNLQQDGAKQAGYFCRKGKI